MVLASATENAANFIPLLTSVGFGGLVGYLIGIAIRYIIKILAIIAISLFLAALMYLQSEGMLNVNWTKLQAISQPVLSSLTNNLNSTTTTITTGHNGSSTSTTTASIPNLMHGSLLPFLPIDMACH
jgi:uncharacterized membrane protein (Fun14 family)